MSGRSKSRVRNGWTQARTAALKALLELGATYEDIARAVGKSPKSVEAKVASLHGDYSNRAVTAQRLADERPAPRKNDCDKHLGLIARANGGMGFPALNLPPAYRVAA